MNTKTSLFTKLKWAFMFISTLFSIFSLYAINVYAIQDLNKFEYARFQFEEGSGNIILDSSGNGRIGLLYNSPSWTTDSVFGIRAMNFNGNTRYAEVNDLRFETGAISVSTWVKVRNDIGHEGFWNIRDSDTKYGLLIYDHDNNSRVYFEYHSLAIDNITLVNNRVTLENFNLKTGGYHHLVVSINYLDGELKYWRDNTLIYTGSISNIVSEPQSTTNFIFQMGRCFLAVRDFKGFMDETRLFNFPLSNGQVTTLYNSNSIIYPASLLIEPDEETNNETQPIEQPFNSIVSSNIINKTTPIINDILTSEMIITGLLNVNANCDLYIDSKKVYSFTDIISFSYKDNSLSSDVHNYLLYCELITNNTKYYDTTNVINFIYQPNPEQLRFFLYDKKNNTRTDISDLYLVTPCLTKYSLTTNGNKNKNLYIRQVKNGEVTFELPDNTEHNFCLIRGKVTTDNPDGFSSVFSLRDISIQTELGSFKIKSNNTNTYNLYLSNSDLYSSLEPERWSLTQTIVVNLVISLMIGIPIIVLSAMGGFPKGILVGGLIILAGMGVSLSSLLVGVIL